MTALGEYAYVKDLYFEKLVPDYQVRGKKIFFAGYFNNIFAGASNQPIHMEWTNKTAIGGGDYITPLTFPFKVRLLSSTYCWLSNTAMLLTGSERADFRIGKYVAGSGGVGNSFNFTAVGGNINQFTSADNNTFPKEVVDNSAGGYEFDAGDSISIECREQGTITPTTSELQVGLVFEILS